MVGRPREFDPDQVLEAAMRAFWANGYEGTSLADLVSATGLHKGSLYQAFGDKHSLYIRSLNRYLEGIRVHKRQILRNADSPIEGLRAVFHGFIDMAEGDADCPQGCLAVKTLVEMAPHDPEVERIMQAHRGEMQKWMIECIDESRKSGETDASGSPEVAARLLMIFMDGLATHANGPMTHAEAHALLDAQLDALL